MTNEITIFHNNRIETCKSSILTCQDEILQQQIKTTNIKRELITIIAKETIAIKVKTSFINEFYEKEIILLTNDYLEQQYHNIYGDIELLFDLQENRKLLDSDYREHCKYLHSLEIIFEKRKQELEELMKKTMDEITIEYRLTEKWSLFD